MVNRIVLIRSNPVNPDPPVEKMAKALIMMGYDVTILGWDRSENYPQREDVVAFECGCANIVRFGIKAVFGGGIKANLKPLLVFQRRIKRWLKEHRNEYTHIHSFDFDTGYVAQGIASKYNKKHVYHILDFYVDSHPSGGSFIRKIVKKAELSVINKADAVIICTEKRREQIAGSNPKQLEVIHNTPEKTTRFNSEIKLADSDRFKIVYVGILAEGRLLEEILDMVSEDKSLELHIGGFGLLEGKVKSYADNNDNIFFYGKIPYNDTLALEKQCDVMTAIYDPTIPNHRYCAPNKFYESIMLGKPVIMVKNTGFDDVITECRVGELIDYSAAGLSAGINSIKSRLATENFAENNNAVYDSLYSWDLMEKKIVKLYKGLTRSDD